MYILLCLMHIFNITYLNILKIFLNIVLFLNNISLILKVLFILKI